MIPVSKELATAIGDRERVPSVRVIADWNRDGKFDHEYSDISGYITSTKLNRGCATSTPEELNTIGGYSSGELTLDLFGHRDPDKPHELTAFQLFGGGASVSPLWGIGALGVRIRAFSVFQTTEGKQETPLFAGWIREAPVTRKARTVQLIANDNTDIVMANVTLPVWGMPANSPYASWSNQNPDINRPILLSWVWEEILCQAGRYTAPPVRGNAILSWTLSGSTLPSRGHLMDQWATGKYVQSIAFPPEKYVKGKFGWALPAVGVAPDPPEIRNEARANTSILFNVPADFRVPAPPDPPPVSISIGMWVATTFNSTRPNSAISSVEVHLEEINLNEEEHPDQIGNRARAVLSVTPKGTFAAAVVSGKPPAGQPASKRMDSFVAHGDEENPWHYYSTTIDFTSNSITITLQVDGKTVAGHESGTLNRVRMADRGAQRYIPDNRTNMVRLSTNLPTQHVQVWLNRPNDPVWPFEERFVQPSQLTIPTLEDDAPLVELNRSLTELAWIPDTYHANAWETLKTAVEAEWGGLWIDARGTVHVASRVDMSLVGSHSIGNVPTYGDDVVGEITLTPRADTKRNMIDMRANFRNAVEKFVWKNQNARDYHVNRGQIVDNVQNPLTEVMSINARWAKWTRDTGGTLPPTNDELADVRFTWCSACWDDDPSAQLNDYPLAYNNEWDYNLRGHPDQRSFYLSFLATRNARQNLFIGSDKGANRPTLLVSGRVYSETFQVTTSHADDTDIARWGKRVWVPDESDWRQTKASIDALCTNMLPILVEGTIGISDVDLPHDPSRELFDVVILANDAGEDLGELLVQVVGIDSTLDRSGFRDTLSLRLIHRPGVAMWDDVSAGWETAWSD